MGFGICTLSCIALLRLCNTVCADEPLGKARVTGIVIGTYQAASRSGVNGAEVKGEGNAQALFEVDLALGPGSWHIEIRGGTTPAANGVTTTFTEANATVGETLDQQGDGRIAVTQLFYSSGLWGGTLGAGLIDPTAFLDANAVANSEYSQFLGSSFVNNPSIDFPSFVLAATYGGQVARRLGYRLFVSSSSGLQDESDPTYPNVFSPGEDGKGVFAAVELAWQGAGWQGHIGSWGNTGDHPQLDNPSQNDASYGVYANIEGRLGAGQWHVRLGVARDKVSPAANFVGAAVSYPIGRVFLGLGVSRSGVSSHQPHPRASIVQVELYTRLHLIKGFDISPDMQYLSHSNFNPDNGHVWIGGLRVSAGF